MSIADNISSLKAMLPEGVTLVAVSKTHPAEAVMEAYRAGQRIFGENRPQEMRAKYEVLPKDIRWHMIGHLQTNKVKHIAPFVELIHSVDSDRLAAVIDREAGKCGRTIDVLLEVHIAAEESKSGWEESELLAWLDGGAWKSYSGMRIRGLMGVASLTDDTETVKNEFARLHALFRRLRSEYFGEQADLLSMGMTSDYREALECGSNMVRIGSLIFGQRDYGK